jgi:DNA primase
VLDALAIDSVSSLGNKLTQGQIELINSIGKTVIVCPDRDKSGGNLIDVAVENNWLVSFPQWEENVKDCAEAVSKYGRLYTVQSVIDGAIGNIAKIKVLKTIGATNG